MTLYLHLLVALVFLPLLSYAQNVTISGFVSEEGSGERLIGATVVIPTLNIGTVTNAYGFYSITLPRDSVVIRASYIGYQPYVHAFYPTTHTQLDIRMKRQGGVNLTEVVVTATKDAAHLSSQMSAVDLSVETIKSLPALLGEADVLRAIQMLPGVQAGNEGTTGLYVRGGGPDQNLILLDGVPVYNAAHLFGFFSVFNPDAIQNVEVVKGGFPARYGGRLSSVIDIRMKEGDKNRFRGEGGIGLVASRLTLEGPLQKGKSSFMVSGRRTYIDAVMRPIMKDRRLGYYFYDLNGKINFRLGERDHIYLSGYFGNDRFSNREQHSFASYQTRLHWGNATAVARWNHQFHRQLFGNLTAHYSRYNFGVGIEDRSKFFDVENVYTLRYTSGIDDVALRYDLDFRPHPSHNLRAGVSAVHHTYRPGAHHAVQSGYTEIDTTTGIPAIGALEFDSYIENDMRITKRLKANVGVHTTLFDVRGKQFTSLQPRVALRYLINDDLSAKLSYAQMNQFIHLLTNSSVGLPTDLWVPATNLVPPMTSHQGAAGLAYTSRTGMEVTVEGYYKTMSNIIEYKEGASFLNVTTSWEDKVVSGHGVGYGGELFVHKRHDRYSALLGYTLSRSTRRFDELNNGEPFPYRYDRRHDFKVAVMYNLRPNIELSADWVYGSGNAITMPVAVYHAPEGGSITVYGERNAYRMPAYHRGDASVKFSKQMKRHERAWVFGVYNIYNRRNAFFIYRETTGFQTRFKQISLFPIIPSVSYQFKF